MTIDKVKSFVSENAGIVHNFRFRGSRNQLEEFRGKITALYPAIFIISLEDEKIKSFSYSDVLLNNLQIID